MSRTVHLLVAAGLASITLAAPALAVPPLPGCKPEQGKPAYPPGQCKKPSISDSTVVPGQSITVYSGEGQFTPGTPVTVSILVNGKSVTIGTVTADATGGATISFTVPAGFTGGSGSVVFSGLFFGAARTTAVALTLGAASVAGGGGGGGGGGGLPITGFELLGASVLGVGLLGAGSLAVVAGRRRRSHFA